MSCGRAHETDCSDVLAKIYEYVDGEMDEASYAKIRSHLQECGPCLSEYDLDLLLKAKVRSSCQSERAPQQLRAQIMARITTVIVDLRVLD